MAKIGVSITLLPPRRRHRFDLSFCFCFPFPCTRVFLLAQDRCYTTSHLYLGSYNQGTKSDKQKAAKPELIIFVLHWTSPTPLYQFVFALSYMAIPLHHVVILICSLVQWHLLLLLHPPYDTSLAHFLERLNMVIVIFQILSQFVAIFLYRY